jgi:hypothetical protein
MDDDLVGHHNAGRRAMHASNIQGRTIVNAITGIAYPGWKVGSLYECHMGVGNRSSIFMTRLNRQ